MFRMVIMLTVLGFWGLVAPVYSDSEPAGDPIPSQSFDTEFPDFGPVRFASYYYSGEQFRFNFYLMAGSEVLYSFPDFYGNLQGWFADEIVAIGFRDVNGDGRKDVLIIANYITGMGPGAAIPFPVAGVYLQGLPNSTAFTHDEALNEKMNQGLKKKTIPAMAEWLKKEFGVKK